MSKVINSICGGGGGSTQLNFSVNNYSAEKTAAGSTNEIQIYPVTTMNSWKIQATEPEDPSINDVWIQTGTGQYEFQPVSGTNLYTAVSGASLWDGSSWVGKSTKCYYNNVWNPSGVLFYRRGTEYIALSAGYDKSETLFNTTKGTDCITISSTGSGTATCGYVLTHTAMTTGFPSTGKIICKYTKTGSTVMTLKYWYWLSSSSFYYSGATFAYAATESTLEFSIPDAAASAVKVQVQITASTTVSSGTTFKLYELYSEG